MRKLGLSALLLAFFSCQSSDKASQTGPELIAKSIEFHDPQNEWSDFRGTLVFQDSLPDGRNSRFYKVSLDNASSSMSYWIEGLEYRVHHDSVVVSEGAIEDERALRMRNYYSYLWGLPMKLLDAGTSIDRDVQDEMLNGKMYKVVRVPYEADTWYFYLEPDSYEMKAYKFYKDEEKGVGEVIYLDGLMNVGEMKIPSHRTWYRTEKPEFLATDKLLRIE
ncbi:DUF6503 family protein [Algoriphagus vanfongensis]|uniref:DUF6503 family protein n=1 Tax=Algoriphagus vanfongensis TaxID=426371 RepID=UPI00040412FC|nr:DUF6503 family protein [Algoriphagus vanfongensis]